MRIDVKKILKEVVIFAVMLFVISNVISYLRSPSLDSDKLPSIDVRLIDGTSFDSEKMAGKPLVVHFWATWCPTCKAEASNIESISKEYEVLTVAVKSGTDDKLQGYMEENGYHFPVLNDHHGQWAGQFKVEAYPTTFIYNSKGELKFTEVGYTTTLGLKGRIELLK